MAAELKITTGDCLDTLRRMPDASIDAVVTDPPYGLGREPDPRDVLRAWLDGEAYQPGGAGFMGRAWDAFVPSPLVWAECWRVLKPGGHLLAFAGSRTYDWMALGVRLAGFEIRDQIMWIYGSGFAKSHNVSNGIESMCAGVIGRGNVSPQLRAECAERGAGMGTALKPAHEPIVMARKPLIGTVAANVLEHGTGAINVDGCRVVGDARPAREPTGRNGAVYGAGLEGSRSVGTTTQGRWPANIMHDGSPEVVAGFPVTSSGPNPKRRPSGIGYESTSREHTNCHAPRGSESGTAARFFYCAKASRAERERGLTHREPETVGDGRAVAADNAYQRGKTERRNIHPTVKPVSVMRWLVRLVTPPGGTVLDPYTGSGTTGIAATLEGFGFVGCELSPEYHGIALARILDARANPHEWDPEIDAPAETEQDDSPDVGQTSLLDLV